MSFIVADESLIAAEKWIALYDFNNMDFGSEDLNEFAKTLHKSFFVRAYLNRQDRPSFSNSSDVTFNFDYPKGVTYTILYVAKGKGYFKVKRGSIFMDGWWKTDDELARALKGMFTDRIVAVHLREAVKAAYARKQAEDERLRKEAEADPKNWTPDKRIEAYVDICSYLRTTTDNRSDYAPVYDRYSSAVRLERTLRSIMSPEELDKANDLLNE